MPKPLTMPQPSSAVSRLLEPGIGRAVASEPGRGPMASLQAPAPTGEIPDIKREFILTESADETLDQTVRLFSRATGANVSNSHFLRALLQVVSQAMPEIERQVVHLPKLKRPSNGRGRVAEREEYERKLAEVLHAGIRASPYRR
jgi:hypothetical protein